MNRAPLVLAAAATLFAARQAHADILSLRVEAHGGAMGGAGMGGAAKDDAFFKDARGGVYGALVGIEALFIDVWVDHHQIVGGDGLIGTWTQFMTGLDVNFDIHGASTPADASDPKSAKHEGKVKGYVELGMGLGFGVGTGQQVMPPLDNAQVSDKGFLIEGRFGAGLALGSVLSLGVSVPVSAGFYFKNGYANVTNNHYTGVEGAVLVVLRSKIKLK